VCRGEIFMNEQTKRTNDGLKSLIGTNWESLIDQIPRSVLVRVSPGASSNPSGQMLTTFTINMIIRLFPVVTKVYLQLPQDAKLSHNIPKWQGKTLLSSIKAVYESVKPPVKLMINTKPNENDICCHVTIGSGSPIKAPGIWAGSDNWVACLSSSGSQPISSENNPVGAYAAATIAVSEIWKRILTPLQNKIKTINIRPLEGSLNFSTYNYTFSGNHDNPPLPGNIKIDRLTMIGLGAGGGAAAYTLASITNLQGIITLIDPDEIESSNLNRYVFAGNDDAKRKKSKVDCINELFFQNSNIRVKPLYDAYSKARGEMKAKDYKFIVSAVDNRKTRRDIQYETPGVILDAAATEQGDFYIWRMIFGETECMFCKHPQNDKDPEVEQSRQLSEKLGLHPEAWHKKTGNNEAFTEEEIKIIFEKLRGKKEQFDMPEVGQRFQEWFKKNCGRLELPEIDGEIPIPFAPVMAGILQAGEVLKYHLFPKKVLKGYYWNTLSAHMNPRILPRLNRPKEGCKFCGDKVFLDQYKRRWMRKN
jgi:molybdopterin/thiamine biosynthesis adenylyltransferase